MTDTQALRKLEQARVALSDLMDRCEEGGPVWDTLMDLDDRISVVASMVATWDGPA